MPVSSFLHISSPCSGDSYWSCHLSALCAFESACTAALHGLLPSGHSALHELHCVLSQCLKDIWWSWSHQTQENFWQLQEKFVYPQAAVFSANMIGQQACTLSFGGVKNLSQWSQIHVASGFQPIWTLADCKQAFKMWIWNQTSPLLPAKVEP